MSNLNFLLYNIEKELENKYKDTLKKYNFNYAEYLVLHTLLEYKELIAKDICDITNLSKSALTSIISKFEKEGYIERIKPVSDERTYKITLTKKGSNLKKKINDISNLLDKEIPLNQKEKNNLETILEKLNTKIL